MAIKKKAGRISPVLMGDYDNTTVYRRLDWVKYGGTSYICKKNNTVGIAPSDPERWQKIIDEANLNIPNNWQMTSWNGKGLFEQNGTTWIVTVPTMSQPSDAATAYWGVKLSCDVGYNIRFGIVNGTDDDSAYVNVSSTTDSYYQFSKIGNGNVIKDVKLPKNAWVWMKFQHYSNNTDDAYAYLILEPITIIDEHRTTFEEATTRRNISSSDSLSTILGKIKKYFSDLQTVAFTGKYSDLSDTPTAIKNPNALTFTGAVTGNYDGSTAKSVAIPSVGNGTLTIQKNGTLVKTFTANQSTNVTANITVPTNATDINAVATSKIMTTKEQLSANTDVNNVAGAVAVKNMVSEINSKLSNVNTELSQKSQSLVNHINYETDLTRRYQLEPNKAYLVTVFAYSFDNADAIMNSCAYFVYTPYSKGANGAIKEIYDTGHITLSINSDCILSIEGAYQYMHYSVTRL